MSSADVGTFAPESGGVADAEALAGRVRGPVSVPGDDGYDAERAGFQTHGQHRPAVIVGATCAEDVRAAVAFAGARELPVAVQGTGHFPPPAAEGGVLVSTRRMAGVRVDAVARTARIEAGARWQQVIDEAAPHGLAPLSGSSPHVGAVAYTLGGGIGLLARRYGYAADHVRSIDVVTADARLRQVTAETAPDLFWALRGGRSNFGVVTGLEVDLVPLTRLYGGGLFFGTELASDVLHAWQRWTATVPEELTSSMALIPFPDTPTAPEPLRGQHVAHVRIAYTGDAAAGERLVEPLRAVGPRLIDTLGDMPYTASDSICNDPTEPTAYYSTNTMLRELDSSAVQTVLDLVGPGGPESCIIEVRHLGGALARPPASGNAVGHRDAQYMVGALSPLGSADLDTVRAAHQRLHEALAPWATGRGLNFLHGENATTDQVRAAYGPDTYRRLTGLKAAHDPANLFRLNHNIPPATGHAIRPETRP